MNICELTITQIHQGLKKKNFSAVELTKFFLKKIKKKDKKIFAFLNISEKLALSQAKKVDKKIAKKEKVSLLAGVPLSVKDNILVKGIRCTAGSKILKNYIAPYDAFVINKLKNQGAVVLGKTNLDEFAMGSSCENSAFGPTKNPYDLTRVPGGSSGGSAAAVAADMCVYALGSDTGGSIRQPASFCGVVGLKPTYGAVSRYGLIAFASSLDQIGPITKNIEDAQIVFDAIKGRDNMDSTSINSKFKNQNAKLFRFHRKFSTKSGQFKIQNLRIGVPQEYFGKGIESAVEKAIKTAIKKCEQMGAQIKEISLPHTKYALSVYYIISPSEASANLARYDGIKFGYSAAKPQMNPDKKQINTDALLDVYLKSRGQGFGTEVKRRIMLGTYALSAGYYEDYYIKAQKIRTLIKRDFEKAFKKVDLIITPTSPILPFKLEEKITNPLTMYLCDIFTVAVSLAGLPAISLPVGKVNGLPVGLQIIAKQFEEEKIFKLGKFFEKIES